MVIRCSGIFTSLHNIRGTGIIRNSVPDKVLTSLGLSRSPITSVPSYGTIESKGLNSVQYLLLRDTRPRNENIDSPDSEFLESRDSILSSKN